MFMNDVRKKEEIRNVAIQDLRSFGIKYRSKKPKSHVQDTRIGRRVFKTPLRLLPMHIVTLFSGQQLVVPKLVHDLCSFILTKVETEGLFRKGGSKARQNEIKILLDSGLNVDDSHHEIDVANVLKTFFRELPEPLFPFTYHEQFLRSMLLEEHKLQAVLLMCLLLPCEHLNTLSYVMQFLRQVTESSNFNKMDSYNLAVVIGPTLFPMEDKIATHITQHRLTKICELFKLLIDNASSIGYIPENIIYKIAKPEDVSSEEDEKNKRKKKRRSGSLTRMFSGLRKMVGRQSMDGSPPKQSANIATPILTKSAKKRKMETTAFSNKKKRAVLESLPQGVALSTPVSASPNPKKISPIKSTNKNLGKQEKRSQWNLSTKRKNGKEDSKKAGEKRWFGVAQNASLKRSKTRHSYVTPSSPIVETKTTEKCTLDLESHTTNTSTDKKISEPDYVRISRSEYEDIKSRVLAIEQQISFELKDLDKTEDVIEKVQTAYEKTLVEAEPLSPTTDQLARRLSKELKIRRSAEQKVMRSPSARKIGSLRRRSQELERQSSKIVQRTQTWNVGHNFRSNLKRGKPNTVLSGLPHAPQLQGSKVKVQIYSPLNAKEASPRRNGSSKKWTSAETFFHNSRTPSSSNDLMEYRSSLVRLRNQNAGMVMAKARLFDGYVESDSSSLNGTESRPRTKISNKIGAVRNVRTRSLRIDKPMVSPRRKHSKSPKGLLRNKLSLDEKENQVCVDNVNNVVDKTQMAVLKDCNRIDVSDSRLKSLSPKGMPQIKRSLNIRSPKRLCHTPVVTDLKKTPLKAPIALKTRF